MGEYFLKILMFSIEKGVCNIFLGVQWLQIVVLVTMDFNHLYKKFTKDAHKHNIKRITSSSVKFMTSQCLEKSMNKNY